MALFLCCTSTSCLPSEPLLFPRKQGRFSHASLNLARDVAIDFGEYKGKTLGSLPVQYLKWMTTTLHGERSTIWAKLANEVLSHIGNCQDGNSQSLDGHHQEAFGANGQCPPGNLNEMIGQLDPQTDFAIYASLLQRCTIEKALSEGERVHERMTRCGLGDHVILNNLLVQMYGKCGSLQHARAVFDNMGARDIYSWTIMLAACGQNGSLRDAKAVFAEMPHRNLVSWNAMIQACAQNEQGKEALRLFNQMQAESIEPDKISFICVLDACGSEAALEEGQRIHASLIGSGLKSDTVVGTALIKMYGKCRSLDDARIVFAKLPLRNVVSWSAMIRVCTQTEHSKEALQLFFQMQAEGLEPNKITFICILDACASEVALEQGRGFHASVVSDGWEADVVMGTALINMYGKCGSLADARAVFQEIPRRNLVSWNAMMAGYAQNELGKEALQLFDQLQAEGFRPDKITFISALDACASVSALEEGRGIHASVVCSGWESEIVVGNALVNMYGKCRRPDDVRAMFAEMPWHNLESWNAMISVCAQNGHSREALQLFGQMQTEGFEPNKITFICVLDACASVAALEEGCEIHASVVGNGWESDIVLGSTLIDMYGKCGSMDDARAVFVEMPQRDVFSWSAMIAVCAQNGLGKEALELFGQMQAESIRPNGVTFLCILTACSHMGLVADGSHYFSSMIRDHGISPSLEHYLCMIDLLGRAGLLDKAEQLIVGMPFEPVASAWLSLLSTCRIHGDVERGVRAANHVFDLAETNASPYVLLSYIYAAAGRLDDVEKLRIAMIDKGIKKVPGCSCIEVNNLLHEFITGDTSHPQWEHIHAELQKVSNQIKEAGYMPGTDAVLLRDLDEEHKEHMLYYHSEKLAIAFGLISTPRHSPIRITKNIRMCSDCHSSIKYISQVVRRKIIVRDINCLHHIELGVCSCKEFW